MCMFYIYIYNNTTMSTYHTNDLELFCFFPPTPGVVYVVMQYYCIEI